MFPEDTKILIVDDSGFTRTTLNRSLRELKFRKIAEASDPKMARQVLHEQTESDQIKLIFTDLNMPGETGLEFLKWLRAQEKYKAIPVIMLTTVQEKDSIIEAARLGVNQYMIKPFSPAQLKDRLEKTWNSLQPAK